MYDADMYGRVFNSDKSFVAPESPILSGSDDHSDPAVAFDTDNNRFLVAWSDSDRGDNIHAQLVSAPQTLTILP